MMPEAITLSLDAMGGDHAPGIVIDGAAQALEKWPDLKFLLHGDEAQIKPLLEPHAALKQRAELIHTDQWISMEAKPSHALRHGRQSSMRLAINAVREEKADAVVSAGNTGALMAMAKFTLKTLPGIDRPAIGGFFPTENGHCIVLDLGANVQCDSDNLVQFATMGAVFARATMGLENPSIGILNIGEEEVKGNDVVKAAAAALRRLRLPGEFYGFVEGNDIAAGTVDVVVTDGFTGNVVIKCAEGVGRLYGGYIKQAFAASLRAKIGYLFARASFAETRKKLDPREYNGAMFLGLQGVCVKSHGGTDARGFANALAVARNLVLHGVNERIADEIERIAGLLPNGQDEDDIMAAAKAVLTARPIELPAPDESEG